MKIELRDPNTIMKLSRLGSFHQSKLSFLRSFLNEFKRVAQAGGTVVVADGHPRIRAASSAVLEIVHSEKGRRLLLR